VFWIEGWASGIDAVGTSRAEWAATNLQRGSRFFADFTSGILLATVAELDSIGYPGYLYYHDRLTPADVAFIDTQDVTYLDVDTRIGVKPLPPTGKYFPIDVVGCEGKFLQPEDLVKFDNIPGISRIYDSGIGHFYDLRSFDYVRGVRSYHES
jgi:hypothetical protein